MRKQVTKLVLFGLLVMVTAAATLYTLYLCLYCAWLTSVPPEVNQASWQYWFRVWLFVTVGLALFTCILVWRFAVVSFRLLRLRHPPGTCLDCGYNLSNSPDICPECGSGCGPRL
jgi:hypothetical protein